MVLPKPPAIAEPFTGLSMGEHAEIMTVKIIFHVKTR